MKNINLTLFNGLGDSNIPFSKYKDNSFIFANIEFNLIKDKDKLLRLIQRSYHLNTNLTLNKNQTIKIQKTNKELKKHSNNINLIVFNIKELNILNLFNLKNILNTKNYRYLLIETKDTLYLYLEVNTTKEYITNIKNIIQSDIGNLGIVSNVSITSSTPPLSKSSIYSFNEGRVLEYNPNPNTKKLLNTKNININDFAELCLNKFFDLGFYNEETKIKNKKIISFNREINNNIINGYYWCKDNPIVMKHKNKNLEVSIYHLIKQTELGKEYLKIKSKEHQEKKILNKDIIKELNIINTLEVNERYLDFDLSKIKIIDDFLKEEKGVLRLKSPMGTAKSKGIEILINKANKLNQKVIIVTNRISVAKDFANKYNLDLYLDNTNTNKSIIVQYDSLYKYDLSSYDIAIFDEYISLLLHHRSNLNTNSNINAIKFKILTETKKVLIADAFLTGYDLEFFKNRDIFIIENKYRDDIDLFNYKHKETFVSELIKASKNLKENEHISASFTSLSLIKTIEQELIQNGVKVISLTSDTPEITKELIYSKFNLEEHNAFDVILYTPTLTVGVSNINNVVSHWHYDSSLGADVISSLQMIKRSRNAKEIHYYIQERQNHYDTNYDSINANAQRNIELYYKNKDKTLLVDVDYETGKLKLTELAKYINKIEVLYNILANNHFNAFELLLKHQFKNNPYIITEKSDLDLKSLISKVKLKEKENILSLLEEYKEVQIDEEEINYLKYKINEKTDEENVKFILGNLQSHFTKELPKNMLLELAKIEVINPNFIKYIKNTKMVMSSKTKEYSKYLLSKAISSDIGSLQNKEHIRFLENLILFNSSNNILKTSYTKQDIKEINFKYFNNKRRFKNFLNKMGYNYNTKTKSYEADIRVFSYLDYI